MTSYTNVKLEDLEKLKVFGFWKEEQKSKYEIVRMKNKENVSLVLFTTKKLFVQGKEDVVKKVEHILQDIKIGKKVEEIKFVFEKGIAIGSDEALKGDSFGGIVVAAVKADDNQRNDLKFAGAVDSKKLDDSEIDVIAERIKKIAQYKVISLTVEQYNDFMKQGGLTELLNKLHTKAITELGNSDYVFVDKYPGCEINIKNAKLETKGESKYVEVAAASILARQAALEQLRQISKVVGFQVPKGSTHVSDALQKVKDSKIKLEKVAKIHFKNVQKFVD